MLKDYTGRHKEKEFLDKKQHVVYPREGQIWSVKLGINIGCEENGKGAYLRPCLVIKKLGSLYFVVPCTTKGKDDTRLYKRLESVSFVDNLGNPIVSHILVMHGKTLDSKRFTKYKDSISAQELYSIKKLLQGVYF